MNQLEQLERLRFEIPPPPPLLPIRSQVTARQRQSYKFKKNAQNSNFGILHAIIHAAHLLKLLDKMRKYEMDPTRSKGATEQTRDTGRTDGQVDRRMDGQAYGRTDIVKPIYHPPNNFVVPGVW